MEKQKTLTAAQRLEGLEKALQAVDNTLRNLINTQELTHQAIKILGNKVDAVVKIARAGEEFSDVNISAKMVENNVNELKQKVDDMVTSGLLTLSDSVEENSFIVGREIDPDTKQVANPRIQIAMAGLQEGARKQMLGKKSGDIIGFGDNKLSIELEQVYKITVPEQQQSQ